jgi:hypothetical protein
LNDPNPTVAIETERHPGKRLGRRKPSNKPRVLKLANILSGVVPTVPTSVDYLAAFTGWQMLGNDSFSNCGPVDVANDVAVVTRVLGDKTFYPTQDDVFDLYRRSGNPNFDPTTDTDDNGVDMQTMLEAVHSGGIGGKKCVAFAKVDVSNLAEVKAAIAVFGGLSLGVKLEKAQQSQTPLWHYINSAEWGGHAVRAGKYADVAATADNKLPDVGAVSWAQVYGLTNEFWSKQVEEAWVIIWEEHFGSNAFLTGVDLAALEAEYQALTGNVLNPAPAPVPVPDPTPVPTPTPTPTPEPTEWDAADEALAMFAERWVNERHTSRENRKLRVLLAAWLIDKGVLSAVEVVWENDGLREDIEAEWSEIHRDVQEIFKAVGILG